MHLKIFALISLYNMVAFVMSSDEQPMLRSAVTSGDFSFVARIERNGEVVCNGVLVDREWVMTVSTCIDRESLRRYKVYLRPNNYHDHVDEHMLTIRSVLNTGNTDRDVIILRLSRKMSRKEDDVRPFIRLSSTEGIDRQLTDCEVIGFTGNASYTAPYLGRLNFHWSMIVSNYGKTVTLNAVDIVRLPPKYCPGADNDKTLCFNAMGDTLCPADDGSPIVCTLRNQRYVAGISSVHSNCIDEAIWGLKMLYYGDHVLNAISGQIEPAVVAFSVGMTVHQDDLDQEIVIYDKVFTNTGHGFHPASGKFICPQAGTYSFQVYALTTKYNSVYLELYRNDDYIVSIYGSNGDGYATGANSAILTLETGDEVYNWAYQSHMYGVIDEVYCTFSGYLLATVPSAPSVFDKAVMFSTGLTYSKDYVDSETVVYDQIFSNYRNGYDSSSGYFNCPLAGIYMFQFYGVANVSKHAWLELYQNHDYMVSLYGYVYDDYASGGNSVILTLNEGDDVHIHVVDVSNYDTDLFGLPDEVYATFSGWLIAPM